MKHNEEYDKANDFDADTLPTDFNMIDIKINPAYYVHQCLRNIQMSLIDENIDSGVFKYKHFIEMLEILALSARLIPNEQEYKEKVEGQITKENLKGDNHIGMMKIANIKYRILCSEIFENKDVFTPIKM